MHSLKLLRGGHTRWACSARCLHTYIYAVSRVRGVYRPSEVPGNALAAFRKGYADFSDVNLGGGEGMPRSKDEWEPIMRFWSQKLGRRQTQGLYEVMSGSAPQ